MGAFARNGLAVAVTGVLSAREIECLRWISEGKSTIDAGAILGLSPRTVKFHMDNARRKLDCHTTVQAVATAVRRGLL